MVKTKEELVQLKNEYESLKNKLKELSEDELKMVTGGVQECDEFLASSNNEVRIRIRGGGGINANNDNSMLTVDGIPLDSDSKLKS